MHYELILPILFQLFTSILLVAFWKSIPFQKWLSLGANAIAVVMAVVLMYSVVNNGVITMQSGNWEAPFGITFVADKLSATLVLLTSIAGLAVSAFSMVSISRARMRFGYFPILHFLLLGLYGAFLTGDIFNLYVWFEVIIISSFVLLTIGGEKRQLEGAINYITMNLLASVIFLTAVAILYGLTGSLNMADLSEKIAQQENRGLVNTTAVLFMVAFGIKSAVFPLYFWLPSSYHTPPSAIASIFAGLLTKVGIYALLRVFTLIFIPDNFLSQLLIVIASLTLLTGGLGAFAHRKNLRKIFSYLIICHIGFMIAGLGMYTEWALIGAIFYLIHDILVKTNLFMISGIVFKMKGTVQVPRLGGLYQQFPRESILFALVLFSLVGVPPLSGFWAKLFLFETAFQLQHYGLGFFLFIGSFITLFVVGKIWAEIFWKKGEGRQDLGRPFKYYDQMASWKRWMLISPVILLGLCTLFVGFGADWVFQWSEAIVDELQNTQPYIEAVLGPNQ